jgi:hypothetical protein
MGLRRRKPNGGQGLGVEALFVFYRVVVRARASLYRKARESGDFGEGKAKLRWSDGLEVAGRQRNESCVTPRLRLRTPDSGKRDVAMARRPLIGARRCTVREGDDWL